ncbi:hypothetical protein [Hymenobacter segetis]|uniref:Uncharacterized protein n=1 Tax=Hymenobacter segetis TaxID=2025509 RepID=A0ABU9LVS3_9BACT
MITTTARTNRFLLLAVSLSLGLLNGCKKDSAVPAEPIEPEAFDLRLFTNGREIKDAAAKDKFLRHMTASHAEFIPLPTPLPGEKVIFLAPDTVILNSRLYNKARFSVVKNNAQHLFYSDTPNIIYNDVRNGPPVFGILMYDMLKYTSPLTPYPAGSTRAIGKQVHVGYRHDNQMYISVMRYHWVWADQWNGSLWQSGLMFNEFNESVIPRIGATDTLAIRFDKIKFPIQ